MAAAAAALGHATGVFFIMASVASAVSRIFVSGVARSDSISQCVYSTLLCRCMLDITVYLRVYIWHPILITINYIVDCIFSLQIFFTTVEN